MEHLDTHLRAANARIERLEGDVDRLGRELARLAEGRQADQERAHQELRAATAETNERLGGVDELRAQMESVAGVLRRLEGADRDRDARDEELSRGLEKAWARLEAWENRLSQSRAAGEQAREEADAVRAELGKVAEAARQLREAHTRHVAGTGEQLRSLREAWDEPLKRLDGLEEARKADRATLEGLGGALGELATADGRLGAAIERVDRVTGEADRERRAELAALRGDLEGADATLRQLAEERVARQQGHIDRAVGLAREARDGAAQLGEVVGRMRAQLETALAEQALAETRRLERAYEHARQELRVHDERARANGAGAERR